MHIFRGKIPLAKHGREMSFREVMHIIIFKKSRKIIQSCFVDFLADSYIFPTIIIECNFQI